MFKILNLRLWMISFHYLPSNIYVLWRTTLCPWHYEGNIDFRFVVNISCFWSFPQHSLKKVKSILDSTRNRRCVKVRCNSVTYIAKLIYITCKESYDYQEYCSSNSNIGINHTNYLWMSFDYFIAAFERVLA